MTNRTRTGVAVAAASVGVIANTVATLATAFSCACQLRCGGGELYRQLRVSVQRQTRGEPEIACRSARAGTRGGVRRQAASRTPRCRSPRASPVAAAARYTATPQQLAGGFGLPGAMRLSGGVEESFRRRIDVLPVQTRRLLLIAAVDPVGDQALVCRAAAKLGFGAEAAAPAIEAGLIGSARECGFGILSCGRRSTGRRWRRSGRRCMRLCPRSPIRS